MANLGDLFGKGSVAEQFFVWQVLAQVVGALTGPGLSELSQLVNEAFTVQPLSPGEAAAATVRGYLATDQGEAAAARSGFAADKFATLLDLAATVPPPEVLLEGLRRGALEWDAEVNGMAGVRQSLQRGGLRAEYADLYRTLAVQLPTWNDALDALLQGQLTHDVALEWYRRGGGDPDAFEWLFNARGTAPTPDMLATMANRGIIPWDGAGPESTSYHQGFLEGPWRDKWETGMRGLAIYNPPPRTVTALLRSGAYTPAQALALYQKEGLSAADAAAYVKDAEHHATATTKELSRTDIESLYAGHVITEAQALDMLGKIGFDTPSANLLISGLDLKRTISNTNNAITRIRTLFIAHKIDAPTATAALVQLGIDKAGAASLLVMWQLEKSANVRLLTPAQIVDAWYEQLITQDEAMHELGGLGYSARDAWILLSLKNKSALPGKPVS